MAQRRVGRLRELGERRVELRAEHAALMRQIRDLIRQAHADGIGVTELAAMSGLTRRAVYDALGHPRSRKENSR